MAADISVYLGVDSASKNEYRDIPGGKDGVRVTGLPPSCAECLVIWSLNRPEPSGPHRPVIGIALPFFNEALLCCRTLYLHQHKDIKVVRNFTQIGGERPADDWKGDL